MKIRLSKEDKIHPDIHRDPNSKELYAIMKKILMRETKLQRTREYLWVVSLATNASILNIELVAIGSLNKVVITPSDIFSFVMQKRAAGFVLVHNHPSGELKPSSADLDLTDKMQQLGNFHHLPLRDHLIITEESYYSMADKGDMAKLMIHTRYPIHLIEKIDELEEAKKKTDLETRIRMAKRLKLAGVDKKLIAITAELSVEEVEKLK
jgi:DNA repair protein RadC